MTKRRIKVSAEETTQSVPIAEANATNTEADETDAAEANAAETYAAETSAAETETDTASALSEQDVLFQRYCRLATNLHRSDKVSEFEAAL
jgi:hypothetical protein